VFDELLPILKKLFCHFGTKTKNGKIYEKEVVFTLTVQKLLFRQEFFAFPESNGIIPKI
jgi:hypothetical protein